MSEVALPLSVANNPNPDRWLRFDPGRIVHLSVGKVEIGQGVLTALTQIAAEELDVPVGSIRVLSGDTDRAPDEGSTSSSLSIEVSGASVRLISAEVRARFLARLAQRLNCGIDELAVREGAFLRDGAPTGQDYWSLAPEIDLAEPASGRGSRKPREAYSVVGHDMPRIDLPAKLTGAAFLHDMAPPGMLHARTLRQPCRGARLAALDEAAISRAAKGEVRIVRLGDFVAFVGENETVVRRAAAAAPAHARWENVAVIAPGADEAASLVGQPAITRMAGEAPAAEGEVIEATYSRPFIAHASLGPSCALAEEQDGHLTVWTHSQAVYPLRNSLANVLGRPKETISVRHAQGAGCYGHNGADDAALDAALIAQLVPGRPIRLHWRREEEFGFEPIGTAQVVAIRAVLNGQGRPKDWTAEIWAGSHVTRPAMGGNMLAHEALPTPPPDPRPMDPPDASGGGGTRNALPLYAIPAKRVVHHLVERTPVRTSALRSLGAVANIFALECFIDELAERAGEDAVAYRLSFMQDQRAAAVIAHVAEMAEWSTRRGPAGTGRGFGIGFGQYKNRSAYAAVVAEVEVEQEVRLRRIWCAADGGLVIAPNGARNQLEGGIVQAASFTLKEQVRFGEHGIASCDWETYPILRFSEVPEISTDLIGPQDAPSLGMGECTMGPTAAAIGNAVAHALGVRIRDLPLTRERIAGVLGAG